MSKTNYDNKIIGSIILEGATTAEDAVIVSDGGVNNRVIAEATLQDMDVENRNHRIYSKRDMSPEINGPRMTEMIPKGELRGELGHPLSDSIVRQQTIDPKYTCCKYLKVWIEGNLIKGHFKGTNNAYGKELDDDLREGCKPAFSLRALGSIQNVSSKAYVKGVKIITWDRVHYPSHKVAYTTGIISEAANYGIDSKDEILKENQIFVPENDTGRIINITGSDANAVFNKLYRESAEMYTILETFNKIADNITLLENGKIKLTNAFGDIFILNADNYIDNVITDYVYKM